MASTDYHTWEFVPRFRRHAFGWRSQPAVQRVSLTQILGRELGLS